ncbi:MAG: ribbon-helix-helix domain-containing protein [Acidobacteriota bacterium]
MAEKKSFLLRVDAHVLEFIKRWADADSRSLNGQIEYVVKKALKDSGRWKDPPDTNHEE